ncbi:MAG: hypothetical protein RIC30_11645 [Marinoscillum sp.]|uniref:hypothetical protein n=1 Tax=Marinoscillum sp. TaxID=2024838 RepID=UPI0032FEB6A3
MDELKEAWEELNSKSEEFTRISAEEIKQTATLKSAGVIEKLRSGVRKKLAYAVFFTLAIGAGIPFAFPLASQVLLTILLAAYLVGAVLLYQELQILNRGVDMTQDVLHGLTTYRDRIKRVLRYEESTALALYPVSISGGFFLGFQIVDRDAQIMTQTIHWIFLVMTIVLLTVGGHWLARWMNRKAFGKYLDRLDQTINELEGDREEMR